MNNAQRFDKALVWIKNHLSKEGGIQVSSVNSLLYPEVTGYFIPTLLNWGERELAFSFADSLLAIQNPDGSFYDPSGKAKCIFDTGQIIRGLLELEEISGNFKVQSAIQSAIKWIASRISGNGEIDVPDFEVWGGAIPVGILLYALEPAYKSAIKQGLSAEASKINLAIHGLLDDEQLTDFTGVSHFHAYILEALVDLKQYDRATNAMQKVLASLDFRGWAPGKPGKRWVCSTAMFQYALVCFKLGMYSEGDRLFRAGAKLQNVSGGWYGSYGFVAKIFVIFGRKIPSFGMYFPRTEIPWAIKYFLDSLHFRIESNFELTSHIFSDFIENDDERVSFILKIISEACPKKLLDLGCGKGRYLKRISDEFSNIEMHACDISRSVTSGIEPPIIVSQGSLLNSPYTSEEFDLVLVVEALEHSVNYKAAIREIDRILRPGGTLILIDKNRVKSSRIKVPDWERWFDYKELVILIENLGYLVELETNLGYEGRKDGLFFGLKAYKVG